MVHIRNYHPTSASSRDITVVTSYKPLQSEMNNISSTDVIPTMVADIRNRDAIHLIYFCFVEGRARCCYSNSPRCCAS